MQDLEIDGRNLIDKYKFMANAEIVADLDKHRVPLEIAIENLSHDFNIGTIIRNANAFNLAKVYIVGKRKYNRRGAMVTDKYMHIQHYETANEFACEMKLSGKTLIAIENNRPQARPLKTAGITPNSVLIFGSEGDGISEIMMSLADACYYIEQLGSTRSINVGCASAIALYEMTRKLGFI